MSDTTNKRLEQLREAKNIVSELDEELPAENQALIRAMRSDLESAGSSIRNSSYDRHMRDALGRAAGVAIANGFDDLADRATRVLDGGSDE